jgi:uncharacterized protein (DUF2267 family)
MDLECTLDGKQEKIMLGEKMNPNQIQFERYWREKISQDIAMYSLTNQHVISEETSKVLDHLRKDIKALY